MTRVRDRSEKPAAARVCVMARGLVTDSPACVGWCEGGNAKISCRLPGAGLVLLSNEDRYSLLGEQD
jgi:hypothetical protein